MAMTYSYVKTADSYKGQTGEYIVIQCSIPGKKDTHEFVESADALRTIGNGISVCKDAQPEHESRCAALKPGLEALGYIKNGDYTDKETPKYDRLENMA